MIPKRYPPKKALELLPLLGSIGREIEERSRELTEIETRIGGIPENEPFDADVLHDLEARAAAHRRGLRLAQRELTRLGCSLLSLDPLTFRIPGQDGSSRKSFVWQKGNPVLKG